MRKAQRILMIIAAIVSIVLTIIFAGIVVPTSIAAAAKSDGGEAFNAVLIFFIIVAASSFLNIILSFMGKNSKSGAILVLNIIFGILSDVLLNAVGGVIGLIANAKEK